MNQLTNKFDAATGDSNSTQLPATRSLVDFACENIDQARNPEKGP